MTRPLSFLLKSMSSARSIRLLIRIPAAAFLVAAVTWIAFFLHAKAFIAGFLYLLVVLPIAFQWGFVEATVASIMATLCLDCFFTQPLFSLYMSDPQDWVALTAFEIIVLVVSRLAHRLRQQAAETAAHEENVNRLYMMSKELLLIERREPVGAQLARLVTQIFGVRAATLWNAHRATLDSAGDRRTTDDEIRSLYRKRESADDLARGRFVRMLLLGSHSLGALCIETEAGRIDGRTIDAIASLAAIALEREQSFRAESSAEASRQSEQLRSAVLDGLAHAYKTPLATIQAASSGLLEINRLDSVDRELVAGIQHEAEHLAALTDRALRTARLETERLKLNPEKLVLEPFLRMDWSRFSEGIKDHPLEIEAGKRGHAVWADPSLLQMALAQFLDNAAKYAEPRSPISLRVAVLDSETVIGVHNYGSYISPDERAQVFTRFYRAPDSRFRAPGTGVGLTVSKQIAEAHRGRVWVESDPQAGTSFFLSLPHAIREEQ